MYKKFIFEERKCTGDVEGYQTRAGEPQELVNNFVNFYFNDIVITRR